MAAAARVHMHMRHGGCLRRLRQLLLLLLQRNALVVALRRSSVMGHGATKCQ